MKLRGEGEGFVKQVDFELGVKDRVMMSGESKEEEVMGEGIGESEIEEMIPE